jgi:uncharacterized integral membrane protein
VVDLLLEKLYAFLFIQCFIFIVITGKDVHNDFFKSTVHKPLSIVGKAECVGFFSSLTMKLVDCDLGSNWYQPFF